MMDRENYLYYDELMQTDTTQKLVNERNHILLKYRELIEKYNDLQKTIVDNQIDFSKTSI